MSIRSPLRLEDLLLRSCGLVWRFSLAQHRAPPKSTEGDLKVCLNIL